MSAKIKKRPKAKSHLEELFLALWSQYGSRKFPPQIEFAFAKPRRWRFDFAWPKYQVAVELEGGHWIQGRHNRGKGFENDCDKYRAATLLGWRVLRYVSTDLTQRPALMINEITELLARPS